MSRTGTFTISQEDTNSGGALDLRGHLMQAGGPVLTAAYNAGHIASHSAPFLKEAAGTLGLLVGMLRNIRANREAFEELFTHIRQTVNTMVNTEMMLEQQNTPLSQDIKDDIKEKVEGALNDLRTHVLTKYKENRTYLDRLRKHESDKKKIQDIRTRLFQVLQLFNMRVDLSNAQRLNEVLEREKDLHDERYAHEMQYRQDLREKDLLAAEVENLRQQMAIEQQARDEQKQLADEEERKAILKREAEKRRADIKKRLEQMKGNPPSSEGESESEEGSEEEDRTGIVDGVGRMEIDDDSRSQMSGITSNSGLNSPRPAPTRIPARSPPPSEFDDSESVRPSPGPKSRPLPSRPFKRPPPPPPEPVDSEDGYDDRYGSHDGYGRAPRPPAGGRYSPRYDDEGYEDDRSWDDQQQRRGPRRPMDDGRDWNESGYYDRRPPPGRRPSQRPYGPPRPDYGGHHANTSPAVDILRGLGMQQPDLGRSGSGGIVNIGSGNIAGNNFTNVGNTTTTYITRGPSARVGRW